MPENNQDLTVKFLTWNIHSGVGTDGVQSYERIGEYLAHKHYDIVCLQEMDTRSDDRATQGDIARLKTQHFQGFHFAETVVKDNGAYGNAILSRFPKVSSSIIDVSFGAREPRNIQELVVDVHGQHLRIVNTHKGLKKFERTHQINRLIDLLKGYRDSPLPTILAGDFNEWQLIFRSLKSVSQILHPCTTGKTFPSRFPLLRLDRIWCDPPELVSSTSRVIDAKTRLYSDHLPIEAYLSMPSRA